MRLFFLTDRVTSILISVVAFAVALASSSSSLCAQSLKRWAVLGSEELQATGITDLTMIAIASMDGMELVEREQIAKVAAELELNARLAADSTQQRLAFGSLLKADALVLLSLVKQDDRDYIKLIISDTSYGARIEHDFYALRADAQEQAAQWIADSVTRIRSKYQSGVTQVIGVSPFLCNNLTSEHDHLQEGYATLLSTALLQYPGIAIVEVGEARTIQKELGLRGDRLGRRRVPFFVHGEYQTDRKNKELVNVAVQITDGKQTLTSESLDRVSLAKVPSHLTGSIARRIIELAESRTVTPLTSKIQVQELTSRADRFSRVGAYQYSIGLREAALLLEPESAQQRIALINDCIGSSRLLQASVQRNPSSTEKFPAYEKTRDQMFHRVAVHLETLVRRGEVNPREAATAFRTIVRTIDPSRADVMKLFWIVFSRVGDLDYQIADGAFRINSTPYSRAPSRADQYRDWTRCALAHLADFDREEVDALEDLYRFLTTIDAVQETTVPHMAMMVLGDSQFSLAGRITEQRLHLDQAKQFLRRLTGTSQPLNRLYGRCGLFALDVYFSEQPLSPQVLAEADTLMKDISRLERPGVSFGLLYHAESLRRHIRQKMPGNEPHARVAADDVLPANVRSRLQFEPLNGYSPDWRGLINCSGEVDVMWTDDRVDVAHAPGQVSTIYRLSADQGRLMQVAWDSSNLWLATERSGVHVVSTAGDLVARFSVDNGLPPYDHVRASTVQMNSAAFGHQAFCDRRPHVGQLRLQVVSKGRCLAIGRFGPSRRIWFAALSHVGANCDVNVFHQAKRSVRPNDPNRHHPDAQFDLARSWQLLFRQGDVTSLLVGRDHSMQPVQIGLDDLKVSTWQPPTSFRLQVPVAQVGDQILLMNGIRCTRVFPVPNTGGWKSQVAYQNPPKSRNHWDDSSRHRQLLEHGEWLYHPTAIWHRINRNSGAVETLSNVRLPYANRYQYYGVSAQHGLVGWNIGDRMYRIHVLPDARMIRETRPDWTFCYVPEQRRTKHIDAVAPIERAGGRVDAAWGVVAHGIPLLMGQPYCYKTFEPGWRTIVYLPNDWRGGDAELARLKDLHQLSAIVMQDANCTDEHLKRIGQLSNLESLSLMGTPVTEQGLRHLKSLNRLRHLRLANCDSDTFSDETLRNIVLPESLEDLQLQGSGFTDAAIALIEKLPKLTNVVLQDTSISKQGITRLNSKNRRLRVSEKGWDY